MRTYPLLLSLLALLGCGPKQTTTQPDATAAPVTASDSLQLQSFDYAWQRINEHYPYPDFRGIDWAGIRDELRPAAAEAADAGELRPILRDMLSRLGESHFGVLASSRDGVSTALPPAPPATGETGLDVRLVDGRILVSRVRNGSPAQAAGVRPGWALLSVAGRDLAETLERVPEDAGPLDHYRLRQLVMSHVYGPPGTVTELRFDTGDEERAITLERVDVGAEITSLGNLGMQLVRVESEVIEDGRVGYLAFNAFMVPIAPKVDAAMRSFIEQGVEGIVVDLRGNPGGVVGLIMGMSGYFIHESGVSLGTMVQRTATLNFVAIPKPPSSRYSGRLAILVDGLSASTSEIMAAGFQKLGRARVFGTNSMGMALPSTFERLPNGDTLQYVIADLTDPSGERVEGDGVTPDVLVPLTAESLAEEGDPVLARALEWLGNEPEEGEER